MPITSARTGSSLALSMLLALLSCASAQAVTVLGPGTFPGLAVDAGGTAYLAWNGHGDPSPLHFCRLPRGETACSGGVRSIPTAGATISRPFLRVDGSRVVVVQGRHGSDVAGWSGVLAHTSVDGGATFGPARMVGKYYPHDAAAGPGDTMSLVSYSGGMFQSVPTDGSAPTDAEGRSTTGAAQLGPDGWHYTGAVGLIDAATPLAVFNAQDGTSVRYRRYSGSGPINAASSWTPPVQLNRGLGSYRLVHGPSGLFLVAVEGDNRVTARKWIGTEFGEAVALGSNANAATLHASQDGGGRLHVTFSAAQRLIHATSDDGATWRSGTVHAFTTFEEGGFGEPRIAAAPDHAGFVAWSGGTGRATDIRIAAVGPDAPVDPGPAASPPPPAAAPAPVPAPATPRRPRARFGGTGSARRRGRIVAVSLTLILRPPKDVQRGAACSGRVTASLLRGRRVLGSRGGRIDSRSCAVKLAGTIKRSRLGSARSLKVRVRFGGNDALAPSVEDLRSLRIR